MRLAAGPARGFVAQDPGPESGPPPGARGRCASAGGLRRNAKNALIVPCRASGIRGSRLLGNGSVARPIAKGCAPRPPRPLGSVRRSGGSWHRPARRDLKLEQKGPHGNRESSISTAFGTPRERGFCPDGIYYCLISLSLSFFFPPLYIPQPGPAMFVGRVGPRRPASPHARVCEA